MYLKFQKLNIQLSAYFKTILSSFALLLSVLIPFVLFVEITISIIFLPCFVVFHLCLN